MKETADQSTLRTFLWGCSGQATARDKRNMLVMNAWAFVWVIAFGSSLWVMETYGDDSLPISSAASVVAAFALFPFIRAYVRFLREADELTQLIHLKALAVGFGAGFIMMMMERFFERIVSFLPSSPIAVELLDLFNPTMVMIFSFALTATILQRRYSK